MRQDFNCSAFSSVLFFCVFLLFFFVSLSTVLASFYIFSCDDPTHFTPFFFLCFLFVFFFSFLFVFFLSFLCFSSFFVRFSFPFFLIVLEPSVHFLVSRILIISQLKGYSMFNKEKRAKQKEEADRGKEQTKEDRKKRRKQKKREKREREKRYHLQL